MNVMIVGAGKSGVYLAEKLRAKHSVTMIEARPERAEAVAAKMPGVTIVRGDGCEPCVLERAGIGQADLVAALTGDDEDNLVVSFLAKSTHRVPLVFARTNHPKNEWMFTKRWGVDVAVSTVGVIYNLIEKEAGLGQLVRLMATKGEETVIDEVSLVAESRAVGSTIQDLSLPPRTHIMAVISGGAVVVPHGETVLRAGDDLLILSHRDEEAAVREAFASPEE